MSCRCGLSQEDVYRISYLTMRGWTLSCGDWEKPGFERSIMGRWDREEPTTKFDLESAYYAQLETEDGQRD